MIRRVAWSREAERPQHLQDKEFQVTERLFVLLLHNLYFVLLRQPYILKLSCHCPCIISSITCFVWHLYQVLQLKISPIKLFKDSRVQTSLTAHGKSIIFQTKWLDLINFYLICQGEPLHPNFLFDYDMRTLFTNLYFVADCLSNSRVFPTSRYKLQG